MTRTDVQPRVVAIGDSLIYGRVDPQNGGWIGLLRKRLEEVDATNSAVFNLGIGGETSEDVRHRIDEVKPRTPNVVIVGVGTNDARRDGSASSPLNVSLAAFEANVRSIIESVKEVGARAVLAGLQPVDEARAAPINGYFHLAADQASYDGALRRLAQEKSALYLPLASALSGTDDLSQPPQNHLMHDGVHPNTEGHRAMFSVAWESLTPLFAALG